MVPSWLHTLFARSSRATRVRRLPPCPVVEALEDRLVPALMTFNAGSLIIPMDTSANGQDNGMLRAYGLAYDLLRHDVPVQWVINPIKAANGDDITVTGTLQDVETSAIIGTSRAYRGGPFVIAEGDAATALPIIHAWQATTGDDTVVHQLLTGSFTGDVPRTLLHAPRVAILKDGNESIAMN
ncbi:MAG: putative internalin, partial [Planctomycetaceae bacterium]|nr:putative internalin [Planctomycetaceae bacterium]